MLKVFIQGLKDGEYDIDLSGPVEKITEITEEFFGNIEFKGKLRKIGRRFAISGKAVCMAKMNCDLTLVEFEELIETEIKISYIAVDNLLAHSEETNDKEINEYFISDDEKYIDLSQEIREELIVNLPMKRIAPENRNKSFDEIFPEFTGKKESKKIQKSKEELLDDRWAPLKNLKIENN